MIINSISIIYIRIILYILLYIFKCIHAYAWDYKLVRITASNIQDTNLKACINLIDLLLSKTTFSKATLHCL